MTAAVLAATLAGCGTRPAPGTRPAAPLAESPAFAVAPTPSPPAGITSLRLVGANGAAAWKLTATGLSVTEDAGQHWSAVPLPAGVVPASVSTVTAAVGRGLWLTVWRSQAIDLYHQDAGTTTWSRRRLVPRVPSSMPFLARQGAPSVSVTLGPEKVVTVVAGWGLTSTYAYSTLFISTDDGAVFAQHPTNIGSYLWSATFVSAQQGIMTAGPQLNLLYRTGDGGVSWSPVRVPGLAASGPGAGFVSYGRPGQDGKQLLLPVTLTSSDGAQRVWIYRTTGAGAAFSGPTGPPLQIPAALSAGEVQPAIAGSVIWLPARGRIYESTDAGAAWTTVRTVQSVSSISVISRSQAIGIATDSGCRSFKSGCYSYSYLVATADAGRTWRTL